MNKRDFIWIGIRILGLFFVIQAVLLAPGLLMGVVDVFRGLAAGDFQGVLRLVQPALAFLIQAAAGLYFIFSGGAVVNLLAKWPPTKVAGQ